MVTLIVHRGQVFPPPSAFWVYKSFGKSVGVFFAVGGNIRDNKHHRRVVVVEGERVGETY